MSDSLPLTTPFPITPLAMTMPLRWSFHRFSVLPYLFSLFLGPVQVVLVQNLTQNVRTYTVTFLPCTVE